jgi:hypothetical protein
MTREIGEGREVFGPCEPVRLEAPHLTRRRARSFRCFTTDDAAHSWVVAQTQRVVHVFVPGKPAEERLPQHADDGVTTILARAGISQKITGQRCQSKRIVEFAIGEQTCIRGNGRSAELHHDAAVEIESKNAAFGFTRWVRHFGATSSA